MRSLLSVRSLTGKAGDGGQVLKIGGVRIPIGQPQRPELVPALPKTVTTSQSTLSHLKWLLQKDILKQDVFLLGVPGSMRSSLILQYLEASNREYEYLAVTRDTTEADIKQRREIRNGSAYYTDLCAVRAALYGRVLVIDGVEKAERNVLPIINNLLENREMQLDDGRFLMHYSKYDKLKEKYSSSELGSMGVERVDPSFHVVALGLPVPRFPGHTLDPPLRSRFQCRHVLPTSFQETLNICKQLAPNVSSTSINDLVSLVFAANSQHEQLQLPLVPIDNLEKAMHIWQTNPRYATDAIFRLLYPMESALRENQIDICRGFMEKFGVKDSSDIAVNSAIRYVSPTADGAGRQIQIDYAGSSIEATTSGAGRSPSKSSPDFVATEQQESLLAELAIAHSKGDFTLLGSKGCGKTKVIDELATRLGFEVETMVLYQDMNARELVQRRRMLDNGDTVWEDSQLVAAAKKGSVCILDGADRVHWSAIESLSSLIHHRRLDLPDGSRLIGAEELTRIRQRTGQTAEELEQKGVYCIPSSFRLLLVGDSETSESRWINEAMLALTPFYTLRPLSVDDQCKVVRTLVPGVDSSTVSQLVGFVDTLRASHDAGLRGVAVSLSLRKLIHIARRDSLHQGELRSLVEKAALSRFLPSITKTAFFNALDQAGIKNTLDASVDTDSTSDIAYLRRDVHEKPEDETMVPDVLFFENAQHVGVMRDMARDLRLGAHLLLIGNQGVGKNKITDRFLQLVNRPRHYIQLHRDTTVESLTVQCSVEDGRVRHEDSALVKAARAGHVLVVDEADKAPLHVIAVLKSLLDSGTLLLGDGRRLQPAHLPQSDRTIPLHHDFRIIMLANRPGFPFLGNDLFGVLGDLFSVHTVDNPDRDSEMTMLRKYAPDLADDNMKKLVAAFTELREMADDGVLQYPYSTRELVNIVKHANHFPDDPLTSVVKNVLDFDEYSPDAVKTIEEVFRKHGIPLGIDRPLDRVFLSHRHEIPPLTSIGQWGSRDNVTPGQPTVSKHEIRRKDTLQLPSKWLPLSKEHMRSDQFTEQECAWQIPMLDVNIVSDGLVVEEGRTLVVATVNPPRIYMVNDVENTSQVEELDISDRIPSRRSTNYKPRIKMAPFGQDQVLLHEEVTNTLMSLDVKSRTISSIDCSDSLMGRISEMISEDDRWRMVAGQNPLLFERGGRKLVLLDHAHNSMTQLQTDDVIEHVIPVNGTDRWLIKYQDGTLSLLCNEDGRWRLRPVDSTDLSSSSSSDGPVDVTTARVDGDSVYLMADGFYCLKSNGFPLVLSKSDLLGTARPSLDQVVDSRRPYYLSDKTTKKYLDPNRNMVLMDGGIVVTALPNWSVPSEALSKDIPISRVGGFLEAVDVNNGFVQYVPIPEPKYQSYHGSWLATISKTPFMMVPWNETKMLSLDTNGGIRSYELSPSTLGKSFSAWKQMIGDNEGTLRMEFERDADVFDMSKLDEPKLGKFDPNNAPHMGGNQWMGGTGGYNTAGLGGVGGPFRLDAGHDVHQMPDMVKQQVPDHILKKAREIAKAEYQKKLKEIQMSEYDADAYDSLWNKVDKQSGRLRGIIEQLEARKKERQWARHQTSGDLDDAKLIEGITGEKNIYRRRMDKLPEPGTPQEKPKRLRLVFDVSGSMYRFNGYDKRLQRSMEAALMVMTALDGKEAKVTYDITGHSGDSPCTNFVLNGHYPKNNKERLDILKQMLAHTQYCSSGDFTVEGLDVAIKELDKETDCDEKLVILISDANLDRYGIKPKHIVDTMNKSDTTNSFVILIGSLGEQAENIQRALPAGKAFVCQDTSELPTIMQNIFASTLI